jgi:hypothetical protein
VYCKSKVMDGDSPLGRGPVFHTTHSKVIAGTRIRQVGNIAGLKYPHMLILHFFHVNVPLNKFYLARVDFKQITKSVRGP